MYRLVIAVVILVTVNSCCGLQCWGPGMGGWEILTCDAEQGQDTCMKVNTEEGPSGSCGNSAACKGAEVAQGIANFFGGMTNKKVDLIHCCSSFLCNGSESQVASLMLLTLSTLFIKLFL